MYSSIATVCLSGNLREKLTAIANAGFKGVEIFENDLTTFDGSAREVGELIQSLGLKLVTLQPFRDFEGLEGRDRDRAFTRAERKFDLMEELGTDLLMVCSTVHPNAQPGVSRAAADFHELGERAAKRGFRVAYEALAWGKYIHDYRDSWEIVRQADHKSVGLVLDTFHIFSRQTDLNMIATIPGERIFLVQTADAPRLSMDHLSWSRHYRCFPGQGELQIAEFMRLLKETHYSGPLSHEVFNDIFRMGHSEQVARDGMSSFRLMANMVGEQPLPPAQAVDGYEFIEIRTTEPDARKLRQAFSALGLVCAGKHHSKPAERWAAAGVNFILNADPAFAAHFSGQHTTSACAFGLRVGNAYDAMKRARDLGYEIIEPANVNASHGMNCIHSVDGSFLYLVDAALVSKIWDTEFIVDPQPVPKASLKGIDHLSVSLPYHHFLSLMLQYRGVFDLAATSSFDVADPRGLIQSQVLQSEHGEFRLAINTSASPSTTSNRFLQKEGGAGVQHIALCSDDIFASAANMVAAGLNALAMPENYYRDLQARFDLPDADISDMRALNILYDEDELGVFWQVYSQPVADAFFFEIVQRQHYQGLGAANAFVRVTAQQQNSKSSEPGG